MSHKINEPITTCIKQETCIQPNKEELQLLIGLPSTLPANNGVIKYARSIDLSKEKRGFMHSSHFLQKDQIFTRSGCPTKKKKQGGLFHGYCCCPTIPQDASLPNFLVKDEWNQWWDLSSSQHWVWTVLRSQTGRTINILHGACIEVKLLNKSKSGI